MKKLIHISLVLTSFFMFSGCSNQPEGNTSVRITGEITNPVNHSISIISMDHLRELVELGKADLDSSGHFELTLDIDKPMEAMILHDRNRAEVFLEPGFDIEMSFDGSDFLNTLHFKGRGSAENNFLVEMSLLDQEYKAVPEEDIGTFRAFVDAYSSAANEKIDGLVKNNRDISDLFLQIERTKVKDRFLRNFSRFELNYAWDHDEMFEYLDNEKDYWSQLDLHNNTLLISSDHRETIEYYLSTLASAHLRAGDSFQEAWKKAVDEFVKLDAHPEYKEFAKAYMISQELGFLGYKEARSDYDTFLATFPESIFVEALNRKFAPWLALEKWNPAPDFSGRDPEGEAISLNEFLGNVVYIDVWASWCKPCYEEFPYYSALNKDFEKDPVIFLFVSIDDDVEAWEKGLSRIPDLEGNHMLVENAWQSDFANKYSLDNIPRYILIDQNGNMADMLAERPSSGQLLVDKIGSLLE